MAFTSLHGISIYSNISIKPFTTSAATITVTGSDGFAYTDGANTYYMFKTTNGTKSISIVGGSAVTMKVLAVGGGAGGAFSNGGGGGGAGGLVSTTYTLSGSNTITIGVGRGGSYNFSGSNTTVSFSNAPGGIGNVTCIGGGAGGINTSGTSGGSGGGSGTIGNGTGGLANGGANNNLGYAGGANPSGYLGGGGGGGAGGVGGDFIRYAANVGKGGVGYPSTIMGINLYWAGGGGGGNWLGDNGTSNIGGSGGLGGGGGGLASTTNGPGGSSSLNSGSTPNAGANTGSGGGGGYNTLYGGFGGSGIVIVSFVTGSNTFTALPVLQNDWSILGVSSTATTSQLIYYNFDAAYISGTTLYNRADGTNNSSYNGVATNANCFSTTNTRSGTGSFTGLNKTYITIPSFTTTSIVSLSVWAFSTNISNVSGGFRPDILGGTCPFGAVIFYGSTILTILGADRAISAVSSNTWYHICAVANGTTGTVYINNAQVWTGTITARNGTWANCYVGTDNGASNLMNGYVDNLRIFNNYALTVSDIATLYNTESAGNTNATYVQALPVYRSAAVLATAPTSNTWTVSGAVGDYTYANGQYIASASSIAASIYDAFYLFDVNTTTFWHSGYSGTTGGGMNYTQHPYNASTYAYQGGGTGYFWTTVVSGQNVTGEWFQVKLPYALSLTSYTLLQRTGFETRHAKAFTVAGSNDGTTWTLLDSQSWATNPNVIAQTHETFNIASPSATKYTSFRIIVTQQFLEIVNIASWNLAGNISNDVSISNFVPLLTQNDSTFVATTQYPSQIGTYAITSSRNDFGTQFYNYQAFAFTTGNTNYWAATSSGSITNVSGTNITGEWLQIQIPNLLQMTSFSTCSVNTSPAAILIVGSNDNVTWQTVYNITSTGLYNTNSATTFGPIVSYTTNTNNNYYTYFRFIVTTAGGVQANLGKVNFNGIVSLILPPTTDNLLSLRLQFENNLVDTSPSIKTGISCPTPVYSTAIAKVGTYSLQHTALLSGIAFLSPTLTSTLLDGLNSTFTISCYIYPTSVSSSVIYMRHWIYQDAYFMLAIGYNYSGGNGVAGKLYWSNQNNIGILTSATTLSVNTWYKVTVVGNSSGTSMYINNVLDVSTTGLTSPTTSSNNANCFFEIGGFTNSPATTTYATSYSGYIDDFRVYRTALSLAQIALF